MDQKPNGREKNVTGQGKGVYRRGEGLGTGPVGSSSGHQASNGSRPTSNRPSGTGSSGGNRAVRAGGGGLGLIVIIAIVFFALRSCGGLGSLTETGSVTNTTTPSTSYTTTTPSTSSGSSSASGSLGSLGSASSLMNQLAGGSSSESLLGMFSGNTGTVSSGWVQSANTGKLDSSVASTARSRYTNLTGGGKDTVTVMVYMCGADLESRSGMATSDLQEMMQGTIGQNVNWIVFTGGAKQWRNNVISSSYNQIYQLQTGGLKPLEQNAGTGAMTSPATLSSFIQYCAKNFPANRNMLIFWDHGGGSLSGYGYDEKNSRAGSMGLTGIDKALTDGGVKFDMIGFDTCLMGTLENALMLTKHGDYLVASEETEPGIGWHYTNWVTALSNNTSIPTTELGKLICDDFVSTCAKSCPGQQATLALIDLAELESTAPAKLKEFSTSTANLLSNNQYQKVSEARSGSREFAASNRLDQIDLVHLALNLNTTESKALANTLLNAIKYNRTSTNMTNAYGLSIYFPYKSVSKVDSAVATYESIGLESEYSRCIRQFASMEAGGQAVSGGAADPLSALLGGMSGGSSSSASTGDISSIIGSLLGGGGSDLFGISGLTSSNSGFLSSGLSADRAIEYIEANHFDPSLLSWTDVGGEYRLVLPQEQWKLIQELELNVFVDDGTGYIDLGLDNAYRFASDGNLVGEYDGTWLAIDEQPVAYYHTASSYDASAGTYTITGRVPVLLNGERAELILVFDSENPNGYIAGASMVYDPEETETVPKALTELQEGDTIDFLCDYYGYDGSYLDSYMLGEQWTYHADALISNVYIDASSASATYLLTDLYHQQYWTPVIP
ncbi:MAG: peptidase C11 [Oscillospiraceae bacterium]|nr:peptidase C11 [Oscillospiraceae bacterium]